MEFVRWDDMGVYVNEDMPKDCYTCFCYETEFNMCSLTGKRLDNIRIRPDDCPLIEIDIVRCGECARRKKNGFCLEHNRYERNDDGFCNYGERRADE